MGPTIAQRFLVGQIWLVEGRLERLLEHIFLLEWLRFCLESNLDRLLEMLLVMLLYNAQQLFVLVNSDQIPL